MELYLSHLLQDEEMKEIIDSYHVGIETIDFSIGYCLDEKETAIKNYKDRMQPYLDKTMLSAHGPFIDLNPASFDTLIKKATMQRFEDAYAAIRELGGKYLIIHTCLIPAVYFESSWRDNSIEFWKEFFKNKDTSVFIYLENMYDKNPEPILEVVDSVAHPSFGICFDIGHANCYSKRTVFDWMEVLGNRIKHFHIHNNDGVKDQHSALDQGTIPMREVLDYVKNQYPDAGWTLESDEFPAAICSLEWLKANQYI